MPYRKKDKGKTVKIADILKCSVDYFINEEYPFIPESSGDLDERLLAVIKYMSREDKKKYCNYSEQSLAEPQVTYENQGIMYGALTRLARQNVPVKCPLDISPFGSSCEARFN